MAVLQSYGKMAEVVCASRFYGILNWKFDSKEG